ncbi:MAG: NADP-dependent malic enzyme [Candidatus Bathyarchaeia archaeon]
MTSSRYVLDADEVEISEYYGVISSEWHRFYKGKLGVTLKVPIRSFEDFAVWYTPGVAQPCKEIARDPEEIFEYTNVGNSVAIVTDGSRVLGLGNIGRAGLPVMEGKALLFKYLGDVDAYPICLSTQDPDEIVQAVEWISPSFGGINLEDIDAPKSLRVFECLTKKLAIPVFYDDYQGTSIVVLAGLLNALKLVEKRLDQIRVAVVGAGSAAFGSTRLMIEAGVKAQSIIMVDSKGTIYEGRGDLDRYKAEMAKVTNRQGVRGGIQEAMMGADVVVALSRPGPGVITEEMVSRMADRAIVFALANPVPEILPQTAKKAGAKIVATGRSDFPNQINNSLGFPAIFRGLLDVRARGINTGMMLTAAQEISRLAEEQGLREDHIMPTMMDPNLYPRVAAAIGKAAVDSGMARVRLSYESLRDSAEQRISKYQRSLRLLESEGFLPPPSQVQGLESSRRVA